MLVINERAEDVWIESLQLFLLDPDDSTPHEVASLAAEAASDFAAEPVASRTHRLLTIPFQAPIRSGRHHLIAVVHGYSVAGFSTILSEARAITVARLRMHNLKVYPTVLPDCQGATSVQFEVELQNVTFDPVDDVRLLYELRERENNALVASGRLLLGRIAAGEQRRIRSPELVEIPRSALIPGRRLVFEVRLHPEALTERRLLAIGTGADVKVEDITIVPPGGAPGDPVLPGGTATLGFTLVNRGNQPGTSPSLTVRVIAEANGKRLRVEPETLSLPNVALAPCGGSLRVGATHRSEDVSASLSPPALFIPEDAEEGDAVVRLIVERVSEETTTDTDEEPPCASVHIDLPNLRLLDLSVPQEVLLGQSASVRFRVVNVRDHPQDRAPVPAGVRVRAELWQKGQPLAREEFRTRRSLDAGHAEFPPVDFALRVPAQAEKGPALVRLEVDPPTPERPRGDVRESNEADNIVEIPIRLTTPLPDLVIESARVLAPGDPPTLMIGAPTALFFLIANRGEGAADPATHEISLALTINIGPFPFQLRAPLRTVETPRLGRDRFTPFLTTVQIPRLIQLPGLLLPIPVPPGPAEILITADSKKAVEEKDEGNNTKRLPVILAHSP
ncbi:MAG: hypothetical protein N0A16_06645 [Blastocatellia bacterium]|nr:hypothetical protein [Blastocatellia bacterium]MCS7157387.1 hypothetical protein [Blastocatellia bacterium]MDW8255415.1 hypothetical protein [Acidobacteriota bacterium]